MPTAEQIEKVRQEYPIFFMEMNPIQEKFIRCKNSKGQTPKRRILEPGNKAGKTEIGVAEGIAHGIGYRPWLPPDDPDFKIKIKIPNNGLVGCETMAHSVVEKLEPTFRRLIPKTCLPQFKKNPQGYLTCITLNNDGRGNPCGSKVHLRSYDQKAEDFEGIDYDWEHWDEPPPEKHLKAAERGKIVTNAPSWFTMTPLKEPYIYDRFSSQAPYDDEIEVIQGRIWDNCSDWCWSCDLNLPENSNFDENGVLIRPTKTCPKCGKVMGFIPRAGIDEYLKTLDPEEREARENGVWSHLSGLVYKTFDREGHSYEDFQIPKSWMKVEGIDPHDARATCWLFGAVSPEEIEIRGKMVNRIYFYDSLLLKGEIDDMVRQVKATRALHGYTSPRFVVLDKKYGEKTQMEDKSWQGEFEKRGIRNIRLSHSSPGDVELGHKIVREYLKYQYSPLHGNKPGIVFAKTNCGGQGKPIHFMTNYQYKINLSGKPEEAFKDWPDVVRYICMEYPKYIAPEHEKNLLQKLKERMENARKLRDRNAA